MKKTNKKQDSKKTKKTWKKWSKEEEKELLKLIELYPHNLSEAFRIYGAKSGRDTNAVRCHFSLYRRREEAKTCMFTIGRRRKTSPNRKNIHIKTGGSIEPVKVSIWQKILNLFK